MISEPPPSAIGLSIAGKFVLKDVLGAGAMGTVYRADQTALGRTVAIKVLHDRYSHDPEMVRRFHQEARTASRVNHPNTIAVIDFGHTPEGLLYLVMEYVRGRTLTEIIRQEFPLSVTRIVEILGSVLSGLHEAHNLGVVHRDLKPDNVLVETLQSGTSMVKVCDFGIAKLSVAENVEGKSTSPNLVCGTPDYMAPEQIRGQECDARTDLYSAGVVLYEMLTGECPFEGGAYMDILMRHLDKAPQPPRERRPEAPISAELEAVCLRALSKDPAARYASATDFRQALQACLAPTPSIGGVICPSCSRQGPAGSSFCAWCGTRAVPAGIVVRAAGSIPNLGAVRGSKPDPAAETFVDASLVRLPFTGRDVEWSRVEPLLDGLNEQAVGHSLVVTGAAGQGKTRLVEELVQRAEARGLKVVRIGPDPSAVAEPWWPIRQAVAAILGGGLDVGLPELHERIDEAGLDRAEVVPGLAELFRLAGEETPLEYAVRRRETTAAALRTLRRRRDRVPTVLVFEDVERFDQRSRQVLERLVESPGETPLLVVVSAAPEAGIDEWPASEGLRLGSLSAADVTTLVTRSLGTSVETTNLATDLVFETRGNPLHLREALKLFLEGGSPRGSLSDVIAGRVRALPEQARLTLQAAAVLGRECAIDDLARILESDALVEVGSSLLTARGFLSPAREGRTSFVHPFVADVVYDGIPLDARRDLHARAFRILDGTRTRPAVIGYHGWAAVAASAASDAATPEGLERTLAHLERAGQDCQAAFDDVAATVHYRRAWELARWAMLKGEDEDAGGTLARLGMLLGRAMIWAGMSPLAEGILRESLEHVGTHHACRALTHRGLARVATHRGEHKLARQELQRGLSYALRAGDAALIGECYLELGSLLLHEGLVDESVSELEEGMTLVTGGEGIYASKGPSVLWRLLLRLAEAYARRGEPARAARYAQAGLHHAETSRAILGQARAHEVLAAIHAAAARTAESQEHRQRAVALMRGLGDRRSTANLLVELARDDLLVGASDQARTRLAEARDLAQAVEWTEGAETSDRLLASVQDR